MKSFSERNPVVIGAIGVALITGIVVVATQYTKLPFLTGGKQYSAYFAEASGLLSGAGVQVAGFEVGEVSSIKLDGSQVLVTFDIDQHIRLGDRTEAAIKTKACWASKVLEITPRGEGR